MQWVVWLSVSADNALSSSHARLTIIKSFGALLVLQCDVSITYGMDHHVVGVAGHHSNPGWYLHSTVRTYSHIKNVSMVHHCEGLLGAIPAWRDAAWDLISNTHLREV